MAVQPGAKAPSFTLTSDADEPVRLEDFKGRKVVLYFYPKDHTSGCTAEACDFRDRAEQFAGRGAVVLGVSKDSVASHQKFKQKLGLNFPLLADPELEALKAYGAWGEKTMYGKKVTGTVRTTVLIGRDGRVERIWSKVKVAGHADEVLEAVGD